MRLFYISPDNSLMSVAVNVVAGKSGPVFNPGSPKPLFKTTLSRAAGAVFFTWAWDVAPDGRFLLNTVPEQTSEPPITAIVNWQAKLKK